MIYVVQPQDTLSAIGRRFGISPNLLMLENALDDPDRLVVGQALLVLIPEVVHSVRSGDSLSSIAREYQVSTRYLYRLNPWLGGVDDIYPGQSIIISYTEQPSGQLLVNGYAYVFTDLALINSTLPYLSAIMPFNYGFDMEGNLVVPDDVELLLLAQRQGSSALMVVAPMDAQGRFNNMLISRVLNDNVLSSRLREQIVETAAARGYAGVDLDFEYILRQDSPAYVNFVRELAEDLHRRGLILSVALAPKYFAAQRGLLYEGIDYQALGQVADLTLLMTYEWGYSGGPPQAVAPIYEVESVLDYGLSEIAAEKIMMGIPNYGYDWTLPYRQGSTARSISNMQALELAWQYNAAIEYDEAAQSPYFNYVDNEGNVHEVWFEDVRSWQAKFALAAQKGLRGVTFWTVSRPFPVGFLLLASQYDNLPISVVSGS